MKSTHTKLDGYILFARISGDGEGGYTRHEIRTGILREDKELALDFNDSGLGEQPEIYTVTLHRESEILFRGRWSSEPSNGPCSCRVYTNGSNLLCAGVWKQNDAIFNWFCELSPKDSPLD